jgi:hypothetical protein
LVVEVATVQWAASPRFSAYGIGQSSRICEERCSTIIVGLHAPTAPLIYMALREGGSPSPIGESTYLTVTLLSSSQHHHSRLNHFRIYFMDNGFEKIII